MKSIHLENLVKIRELKIEPPEQKEFSAMLAAAKRGLQDAKLSIYLMKEDLQSLTVQRTA